MASHHPPCSTGTPLATLGFLPSLSNLLTGFFLPLGFFRHLGRPSGCPSPTKAVQSSAGSCCPGLRSPRQLADRPLHLPYTVSPWSKLRCVLFPAVLPPPGPAFNSARSRCSGVVREWQPGSGQLGAPPPADPPVQVAAPNPLLRLGAGETSGSSCRRPHGKLHFNVKE